MLCPCLASPLSLLQRFLRGRGEACVPHCFPWQQSRGVRLGPGGGGGETAAAAAAAAPVAQVWIPVPARSRIVAQGLAAAASLGDPLEGVFPTLGLSQHAALMLFERTRLFSGEVSLANSSPELQFLH